jgi:hypothetical protein
MSKESSIKLYSLKNFYMVTDIKEHKIIKKKLLEYFNLMPDTKQGRVSKTDWKLLDNQKKYKDYFMKKIRPYYNKISKKVGFKKWGWTIYNMWFQIYNNKTNDTHGWHNHQKCNWSNVYFIHLPNNSLKTQLFDKINNKPIKNIKVKEGQLLTFPANIMHRSPVNNTNDKKIIISFNSDMLIETDEY